MRVELQPDMVIADHKLICLLGKGSFAETWLCERLGASQPAMDRRVAVKFVNCTERSDSSVDMERDVRDEFDKLIGINHPNVVKVLEFLPKTSLGLCGFSMKFLRGDTLQQHVDLLPNNLDVATACRYGTDVAMAMVQISEVGLVHRDLKPANILLDDDRAGIVDFGVATMINDDQSSQECAGTLPYMAPEQLLGMADTRSDIYSLGCNLFFMLRGRPPIVGVGDDQFPLSKYLQQFAVMREEVPSCGDLRLDIVLKKLLAKDPADRYQSFSDVIDALKPFLNWASPQVLQSMSSGKYWHPYAIKLIFGCMLEQNLIQFNDLAREARIPESDLTTLLRGVKLTELNMQPIVNVASSALGIDQSQCYLFLAQPNDVSGDDARKKIIEHSRTPAADAVRTCLNNVRRVKKIGWLHELFKGPRGRYSGAKAAQMLVFGNSFAAIHLTSEEMPTFSQTAFSSSEIYNPLLITTSPGASETSSHIEYSNRILSRETASLLANSPARDSVSILEGGVGGAHTAYWMTSEIDQQLSQQNGKRNLGFHYRGYELVPEFAYFSDEFLSGKGVKSDCRGLHFNELHKQRRMSTFHDHSDYVENCQMEHGIEQLYQHMVDRNQSPWLDVFVCSYAFHHIPNGVAIWEYVSGTSPNKALTLMNDAKRKHFRNDVLDTLKKWSKASVRSYLPPSPRHLYAPARVFLSLLNPSYLSLRLNALIEYFDRHLPQTWIMPATDHFPMFTRNPQEEAIWHISQLLKPGGLFVLADPDGTSTFNWLRQATDPEATLANFNSLSDITRMLQPHFDIQFSASIEKTPEGFKHYTSPPKIGVVDLQGGYEGNMGYMIIAKKKRDASQNGTLRLRY